MNSITIKHIVKLSFDDSTSKEVILSYTEEHPGGETPTWSLLAEKESCEDNIDDLLEQQGYVFNKPYTDVQVISTSISNGNNILEECKWIK